MKYSSSLAKLERKAGLVAQNTSWQSLRNRGLSVAKSVDTT